MYLLKNVYIDHESERIIVEEGIEVCRLGDSKELVVVDQYWGATDFHIGDYFDFNDLVPTDEKNHYMLPYISDYAVKNMGDGFKFFLFNVTSYKEDKVKGYIIFIKYALDIKTSGNKLYGRYPCEMIVLLKDGDYIEFENEKLEVINNKLILYV